MVNLLLLVLVATTTACIVLTLYSKKKKHKYLFLGLAVSKSVILVMINIFKKGQIFIRESLLPVVITAGSLTLTYLLLDYFEKKSSAKKERKTC